ncbi:hypothetical protein RB195_000196 [Necator americanus]|uniref:G-protein coupled receptors family 1 profile domain-containing protein n=1 Tax=Necator americanus TaxID=51031 RepID=A0ABR1D8F5_NECAM
MTSAALGFGDKVCTEHVMRFNDNRWTRAVSFIGLVPLLLVVLQILRYRRNFTPFRYLILSKLIADGLELFIVMMLLVSSELIFAPEVFFSRF